MALTVDDQDSRAQHAPRETPSNESALAHCRFTEDVDERHFVFHIGVHLLPDLMELDFGKLGGVICAGVKALEQSQCLFVAVFGDQVSR